MISRRLTLFAGMAMLASTALAGAQTGTDRLFDNASFGNVRPGTTLNYSHDRSAKEAIPVRAIKDGSITVLRDADDADAQKTVVTLRQHGGKRRLENLPADRGNPIFVVFLESSVSAITHATKGSPFYIRNRIKDAFASGGIVSEGNIDLDGTEYEATHIEYRPFKDDRNAARMGAAFENLSIRFTLSEAVPGHFVALTTQAKVGDDVYFIEDVRFVSASDGEQ